MVWVAVNKDGEKEIGNEYMYLNGREAMIKR